MEQLGSHWMEFHEILYFGALFRIFGEKIQDLLKSDILMGTLLKDLCTFMTASHSTLFE